MVIEKRIESRLNKYYKQHFGERDTDEWYVNPASNQWRFERDGQIITLICDQKTGKIKEETLCKH